MTIKHFIIPITFAVALALGAAPASAQHVGGGGGHMGGGHMGGGGGGHMGGSAGAHTGGEGHMAGGGFDGHHDARFDHGFHGGFHGPFVPVHVIHPFHGPFFTFRPRFGLGFGLFVGYPVPYPWDHVAPYPYYDYPYYDDSYDGGTPDVPDTGTAGTVNPVPSADEPRDFGGMSLDITPGDATVWIDGTLVGTAENFSPSEAPLTLRPGVHHVVIGKQGYHSMTFESEITAGQVLPYQGTLQPE
jgi:PEGA domain